MEDSEIRILRHVYTDDPPLSKYVREVVLHNTRLMESDFIKYIWRDADFIRHFIKSRLRFFWNNFLQNRGYPEKFLPGISDISDHKMTTNLKLAHQKLVLITQKIKGRKNFAVDIATNIRTDNLIQSMKFKQKGAIESVSKKEMIAILIHATV